jgi:hypothetical protein
MYAFYHRQDNDSRLKGEDFHIGYGPTAGGGDGMTERAAKIVVECLRNAGLSIHWEGDIETRILVRGFDSEQWC